MGKIEYDDKYVCKKCGGKNEISPIDDIDGTISECETICSVCGFEDYWAYGHFESGIVTYEELKQSQEETNDETNN